MKNLKDLSKRFAEAIKELKKELSEDCIRTFTDNKLIEVMIIYEIPYSHGVSKALILNDKIIQSDEKPHGNNKSILYEFTNNNVDETFYKLNINTIRNRHNERKGNPKRWYDSKLSSVSILKETQRRLELKAKELGIQKFELTDFCVNAALDEYEGKIIKSVFDDNR